MSLSVVKIKEAERTITESDRNPYRLGGTLSFCKNDSEFQCFITISSSVFYSVLDAKSVQNFAEKGVIIVILHPYVHLDVLVGLQI